MKTKPSDPKPRHLDPEGRPYKDPMTGKEISSKEIDEMVAWAERISIEDVDVIPIEKFQIHVRAYLKSRSDCKAMQDLRKFPSAEELERKAQEEERRQMETCRTCGTRIKGADFRNRA